MAKFLGLIDILAGLIFLVFFYGLDVPRGLMVFVGVVLIIKGVLFILNFFSWIDIAIGIVLVFSLISSLPPIFLLILAGFLGLKGLFSLFTF